MVVRRLVLIVATVAVAGLFALPALAASPHFVTGGSNPTPECTWDGTQPVVLYCTFKIAGLGSASEADVQIQTTGGCENKGGNKPPGHFTSPAETFDVTNGQITVEDYPFDLGTVCRPRGQEPFLGSTADVLVDGVVVSGGPIPIYS
jgi:hypothetical protein